MTSPARECAPAAEPIPGLRGLDHVGLTVPDIDQAVRFFSAALGFEEVYRHGPYRDDAGDSQRVYFARHPRAVCHAIVMMCDRAMNLELLQFSSPDQRRQMPSTGDWGSAHLAFYVADMGAAVARVAEFGGRVLGGPLPLPGPESGPMAEFCFFLTPWRQPLELISYPNGRAYEATAARRLNSPLYQAGSEAVARCE